MTIEEKVKAYDEALKQAKFYYGNCPTEPEKKKLENIFPELRESKDERIINQLIHLVQNTGEVIPIPDNKEELLDYLEKQKEQKPVDYEHEMWKNCEANFEGGKKEVIEHPEKYGLQKEQKPTISKEAIRDGVAHFGITQYQIDNWLKKHINIIEQKEQNPKIIIPKFHIGEYIKPKPYNETHPIVDITEKGYVLDIGMTIPFKDEDVWEVVEQKPADDKAFEEWIDSWWKDNKVNSQDSYYNCDEIQFNECEFKNFCRGIRNMYQQRPEQYSPLCNTVKDKIREYIANHFVADTVVKTDIKSIVKAMEEGVRLSKESRTPAEWSDSVAKEMFIKALERAVEQTKKGYELTNCDKHSWWKDFKAYCGIAPTEWSEEDKTRLTNILIMLKEYLIHHYSKDDIDKSVDWLESLPERFNLQPKQEWTQDDEQYLLICKNALQKYQHSNQWDANIISDWLERRLKFSYQSKNEWSEEDDWKRKELIQYLEEKGDYRTVWMTWLKSLRPRSKEELAKMLQEEYNKGKEEGERIGHTKGYDKGYKDAEEAYNKAVSYHP